MERWWSRSAGQAADLVGATSDPPARAVGGRILIANVLDPLINVADAVLRFWHDQAGFGWGASIIALTVCVRLFILPLTFKQVRSMQAMQRLQPELKRLQERHKGDRQRMNQEVMSFYQEHKVNPLGSCLPLVLQFPFFMALFYLLRGDQFKADIAGEERFLIIPNLAEKVTGHPGVLATLIVLYVGTQLGASLVTAITLDKNQRRLMLALPFIFVFFILNFEAGLIVYWITTNLWTIGQQLAVKKLMPAPAPLALDDGRPAKSREGSGQRDKTTGKAATPESAAAGNGRPQAAPRAPRKRKKRSGRRR